MKQTDLVGDLPEPAPFKDIRNQRDAVAEEKATLCKLIREACFKCPHSVVNGSIQITREWRKARDAAMKVAGNKRASVHELTSALSSMERYK